ncbi:MAG: MFS transporter [Deltaproteobacteria bacterium]|nr:MFS transporter [Deltaproteobacteria bacterium]
MIPSFLEPGQDGARREDRAEVDRLFKRYRLQVLVALTLTYGFYYTCRIGFSVVKKPLIDGKIYDASQLGRIGACMLAAYSLGKIVNGLAADRVNVARFIPLGLLLSALMNILMGGTTTFYLACVLWFLNGFFQGVGATASVVSLTHWYSNKERGRAYGMWSSAHSIGEGITFLLTAQLVAWQGWEAGFIAPGILCVLVAAVGFQVLKDRPQVYGLPSVKEWKGENPETPPQMFTAREIKEAQLLVLKTPTIWICGVASALMYVTRYGLNNWGVLYLQEAHGYTIVEASGIVGVNTVAGFFGSVAYGFMSDKLFSARRPPVTLIFGFIEVLALVVIFFGPKSTIVLTIAFFVYGFTLSGLLAVLGGLFAVDLAPKRAAGMAMGFVGFVSYTGAVVQELISGELIQAGTTINEAGVKHVDFTAPVEVWLGSSVVSMILAATLWKAKFRD